MFVAHKSGVYEMQIRLYFIVDTRTNKAIIGPFINRTDATNSVQLMGHEKLMFVELTAWDA